MKENVVIYHGKCTDGFGSAYSAWKKLGDSAEYIPMTYENKHIPDIKGKNVWILDFSFPLEEYEQILKEAKDVHLLDHHITAFKSLCGCKGCFFNMEKSGARLSWEHFHPDTVIPEFIKLIEDGDLYKFKYPDTKAFYRAINMLPQDFLVWQNLEREDYLNAFLEKGRGIEEFWQMQLTDFAKDAVPVTLQGKKGLMVNAPGIFASDLGNKVAITCGTFALVWSQRETHIRCSLRSVPGFDCSEIAACYGGGGHAQASAFSVPDLKSFLSMLEQ